MNATDELDPTFKESHSEMRMSSEQSSSSLVTRKIFAPGADVGDTGSLKRRNPREMFTDSSFYSPKHHPSVADQVEMAHKLSSSLYDDGNKRSKGQVSLPHSLTGSQSGGEKVREDRVGIALKSLPHHCRRCT